MAARRTERARIAAAAAIALTAAAAPGLPAVAADGDPARGARVFLHCYSCHSVDPNESATLSGPTLWRIVGRRAGAVAGFDYSEALAARAAAGLSWTEAALDAFIADPQAAMPGVAMGFFGIPDAGQRADLIAYLRRAGEASP
ncbi:MAG: c-type cytochrome [Alphaproteobacteria bacterium]|nr:c-type cytochrome [Alphaproteobacteria bacterium]